MSTFIPSNSHDSRGPSQYNKAIKGDKRQTDWEGKSRNVLIDEHDCICRKSKIL